MWRAALLALLPGLALAAPAVVDCSIDIDATEGAGVTLHADAGGGLRMAAVTLYGETGALEMDVIPLDTRETGGDAALRFRLLRYSRHIAREGPFEVIRAATGAALVRGGAICAGPGCYSAQEVMPREDAQGLYEAYLAALPGRWDCTPRDPG